LQPIEEFPIHSRIFLLSFPFIPMQKTFLASPLIAIATIFMGPTLMARESAPAKSATKTPAKAPADPKAAPKPISKGKTANGKTARHNKKGAKPTPASLVHDMQKAIAYIAIEGKKDLNPKSKQERPFWGGLKLASKSVDLMKSGIKAKDSSMLKGLDGLGRGIEQVGAAWGVLRRGEKTSKIGRGVLALHAAYETYLTNFGPVVARYKKAGPVSKKEQASLLKAQGEAKRLRANLTKLQAKAGKSSLQARMVNDLLRLLAELAKISVDNSSHYCQYMHCWERFSNTYYAYNECIGVWYPGFYSSWKTVYTDYSVVSTVFSSNSWSYYESWDYTSESVESYGDYYESTVEVEDSELTEVETFVESYEESSATEEVAAEDSELEEDYEAGSADEEVEGSFSDEAMDDSDDADADGVEDDADTDDDNDGTADDADTDDDGDGVSDAEDVDMGPEADKDSEDSDDDGVSDADDNDDDNDGTVDAKDGDDDGDGVDDSADSADDAGGDDGGGAEEDAGGGDDGGGAEEDAGGDDGGGAEEDAGGDDGGGAEEDAGDDGGGDDGN